MFLHFQVDSATASAHVPISKPSIPGQAFPLAAEQLHHAAALFILIVHKCSRPVSGRGSGIIGWALPSGEAFTEKSAHLKPAREQHDLLTR